MRWRRGGGGGEEKGGDGGGGDRSSTYDCAREQPALTCNSSGLSLSMTARSTPLPLSVENILKLVLSSRAVINTTMLCFNT